MATASRSVSTTRKRIPIRKIGDGDLSFALKAGWEDFMDMRGDIFIAGLVYTFIGLAAVVMTTSRPLIPFFFPVVAGVGLLGPIAAVGFYELAKRREAHEENLHWFNFLDVRKRPSVDDMGIVAGLLLAIFALWLIAAGLLYVSLFGWSTPTSIGGFLTVIFTTPFGWALIVGGGIVGALFAGPPLGLGMGTAGLVLAIMVIPFIASVMREVFLTVPGRLKESAYALGSTRWEVVWDVVLPYTRSAVVGGIFLGLGRALGETMAVTFVIGNAYDIAFGLLNPGTSIASTIANEFPEALDPLHRSSLMAVGFVLFALTLVVLAIARLMLLQLKRREGN